MKRSTETVLRDEVALADKAVDAAGLELARADEAVGEAVMRQAARRRDLEAAKELGRRARGALAMLLDGSLGLETPSLAELYPPPAAPMFVVTHPDGAEEIVDGEADPNEPAERPATPEEVAAAGNPTVSIQTAGETSGGEDPIIWLSEDEIAKLRETMQTYDPPPPGSDDSPLVR